MKKHFSNEKGITMLTLTLTIIVMAVIMSVITFYVTNSVQSEQFQKMKADIREIESKALMYYVQEGVVPVYSGGFSDIKTRADMRGSAEFFNPNDGDEYARVNLDLLGIVTAYDTTYYINTESLTVYAIDPIKIENKFYPRMAGNFTKIASDLNVPEWEKVCFKDKENAKKFKYDDNGYITGLSDTQDRNIKDLIIPASQPNGMPVIGILSGAFDDVVPSDTLIIPNTIKSLPSSLFGKDTNVKKIYCDASGIRIDTFEYCKDVEEVKLGPSCVMPEGGASSGMFRGREKLTKVWIETKSLGSGAFSNCLKLKVVILNDDTKVIPDYFFDGCSNSKTPYMSIVTDIPEYTANSKEWPDFGNAGKRVVLPKKLERIGIRAFGGVQRFPTILDLRNCPNLIYIGSQAFDGINSNTVRIKDAMNYQPDSFKDGMKIEKYS